MCVRERRGEGIQSSVNEKWPSDQSTIGEKDVGYIVWCFEGAEDLERKETEWSGRPARSKEDTHFCHLQALSIRDNKILIKIRKWKKSPKRKFKIWRASLTTHHVFHRAGARLCELSWDLNYVGMTLVEEGCLWILRLSNRLLWTGIQGIMELIEMNLNTHDGILVGCMVRESCQKNSEHRCCLGPCRGRSCLSVLYLLWCSVGVES